MNAARVAVAAGRRRACLALGTGAGATLTDRQSRRVVVALPRGQPHLAAYDAGAVLTKRFGAGARLAPGIRDLFQRDTLDPPPGERVARRLTLG
jgi:hypothetical protein